MLLKIANEHGNFLVCHKKLPKSYAHVTGQRLQPLCRKLRITFCDAVVGFDKYKKKYAPIKDGVIISKRSEDKLRLAILERDSRSKKRPPRKKKIDCVLDAGLAPHTRTADWWSRGDICTEHAQFIQWQAWYRHNCTDYDLRIGVLHDQQLAREEAEENPIPDSWEAYLAKYDFPYPEIAEHLASILRNPIEAHPRWFCKKVCNIAMSCDLNSIKTYEDVRDVSMDFGRSD